MARTADPPRDEGFGPAGTAGRIAWCSFNDATTHTWEELGASFRPAESGSGGSTTGLLLQTCHRVEWYEAEPATAAVAPLPIRLARRITGHEAAASRLARIAAGTMSLILGEQFVFQQVRTAFDRLPGGHPLRSVGDEVLLLASQARDRFGLHAGLDYRHLARTLLGASVVHPDNLVVVGGGMLARAVAEELGSDRRVFVLTRSPKKLRRVLPDASGRATVLRITELPDTVKRSGYDLVLATSGLTPMYREHIARLVDDGSRHQVVDLCATPVLRDRPNYQHLHHPAVTHLIEDANRPTVEAARAASSWIENHYGGRS
ncbi:hypothetical protein [Kitasatospora sp. NRRL B-11411]|uniref:hypothetical protein n=1 Tax=Kitasatospora sp. NRRL B-11411 TaxID=1463822 RepID=UPI0004C3F902|nr:hypothetical protein [Kitasatospora sp. NRRL B-11411]